MVAQTNYLRPMTSTLVRLDAALARRGVHLDEAHRRFLASVSSPVSTSAPLPTYGEFNAQPRGNGDDSPRVSSIMSADQLLEGLAGDEADFAFWDEAYVRFGIPIAWSEGGDPIVQALAGAARGAIFLTDHDFFFSWLETWVEGEELEEIEEILKPIGFEDFASMTATQFFAAMTSDAPLDGLFRRLADDFESFYGRLGADYGLA